MTDDHHLDLTSVSEAILMLQTKDEVERFLIDLCTPQEIKELNERWHVCQLLYNGGLSYRTISELTGVSTTTVTRVSRFLNNESYKGYKIALERIENVKNGDNDNSDAVKYNGVRKEKRK